MRVLDRRGDGIFRSKWDALRGRWDSLRESYWFVPMLMALGAAGLALGLIELDTRLPSTAVRRIPWIRDAGAEGTRAVLSTVAGSMITVTGVVFSITIVALSLTSSQFGPRLLRNFLRDRGNQGVLGTFVATFLYSLLVLRAVEVDRVPHVAAAVALVLAVTSVFVLIYFVHHAASSIQASSVIASVAREIEGQLPSLFPEETGHEPEEASRAPTGAPDVDAMEVVSTATGYVRVLSADEIFDLAVERDLVIELVVRPGDFVAEGRPLARIVPAQQSSEELAAWVEQRFVIGPHRTGVQDLAFLTDQLTEMAVRALSPGTNDPKTAIACIHRLGVVIASLAGRKMPSSERYDADGRLRVVAPTTSFSGLLAMCLDPILRYGVKDAEVVEAVLLALGSAVESCPRPARRVLLLEEAYAWSEAFSRDVGVPTRDRERVENAVTRVAEVAARQHDARA